MDEEKQMEIKEAIRFEQISKYYASTSVQALDNVSFSVKKGEIHAICGENGAGKSTLMNTLFGLEKPDSGSVYVNEEKVSFKGPSDAIGCGIGMVHQHFKLVSSFTVKESILLGIEKKAVLNSAEESEFVRELSSRFNLPIDPDAVIETLPIGLMQRVEILKMLARDVDILILDEPTAVLTPQEVGPFLDTMKNLSKMGKTILFISHKLGEVLSIADTITVMRKGKVVSTSIDASTTDIPHLADLMVGRKVLLQVEKTPAHKGEKVLEIENLSVFSPLGVKLLDNVSFSVHSGEIYGIAGVSGNGQEALVAAIAGHVQAVSGSVKVKGTEISRMSIREKRKTGIAYVPEDRIHTGLNTNASLLDNSLMGFQSSPDLNKGFFLDWDKIEDRAGEMIKDYSIAGSSPGGIVSKLSGGNMQKVVLARELAYEPALLVVEQPTRGLDVGSIEAVHKMLIRERDRGVAVLLVSVELEEILSLSDRVGVMYSGVLQGELEGKEINEKDIGLLMVGSKRSES